MNNRNRFDRERPEQRPFPQGSRGERHESQTSTDVSWVRAVICEGNYTLLDEKAKDLGNRLANDDASRTQLRALFGTIKRLEPLRGKELDKQLAMLRPRLAYAASRAKKLDVLRDVLTEASARTQEDTRAYTQRLVDLMEAILCYERAATSRKVG